MSQDEFQTAARNLSSLLRSSRAVLFLGSGADLNKISALLKYRWRAIITVFSDEDFFPSRFDNFCGGVPVKPIYDISDLKGDLFDGNLMPVIYIKPIVGDVYSDDNVQNEETTHSVLVKLKNALISSRRTKVVVEGYRKGNFDCAAFHRVFFKMPAGIEDAFWFFGGDLEDDSIRRILTNKKIILSCKKSASELALDFQDEFNDNDDASNEDYLPDNGDTYYYSGGKLRMAPDRLPNFINGRLLNEKDVDLSVLSSAYSRERFYKFLQRSFEAPQWYGYINRLRFAFPRDKEKDILDCINEMADDKNNENRKPIIIEGQTCCGKSVVMASLAMRIYQDKQYPVIFYCNKDTSLEFAPGAPWVQELLSLVIDLAAIDDSPVIVFLDRSYYNITRETDVFRLNDLLNGDKGKKVVIVASAMQQKPAGLSVKEPTKTKGGGKGKKGNNHCSFELAVTLTDKERERIKETLTDRNKGGLSVEDADALFKKESKINLLAFLYKFYESRRSPEDVKKHIDNMKKHVASEITGAAGYLADLAKELREYIWEEVKSKEEERLNRNPFLKLKSFKFDDTANSENNESDGLLNEDNIYKSVDGFINILALVSFYINSLPLDALRVLVGINSYEIVSLFESCPSFIVNDDTEGGFGGVRTISFRSRYEAKLYLDAIENEKKIDRRLILKQCINKIVDGVNDGSISRDDIHIFDFLARLLRAVGSNADDDDDIGERSIFQVEDYPDIVREIAQIRQYSEGDDDMFRAIGAIVIQELKYIRDYIKAKYFIKERSDADEKDISLLFGATKLAEKGIRLLADRTTSLRGNASVEFAFCWSLYLRLCPKRGKTVYMPYNDISEALWETIGTTNKQTINNQPKSYPYVAFMRCAIAANECGCGDYAANKFFAETIKCVEEGRNFLDNDDRFQKTEARLYDQFDRKELLNNLFDKMTEAKNPLAPLLRAQYYLRKNNVNYAEPLEESKVSKVLEAIKILEEDANISVSNLDCLGIYLLVRLKFLLFSGRPFTFAAEYRPQIVRMSERQWNEVCALAKLLLDKMNDSESRRLRPLILRFKYLYALALANLGRYQLAYEIFLEMDKAEKSSENDFMGNRAYTWHLLCDEDGAPVMKNCTRKRKEPHLPAKTYVHTGIGEGRLSRIYIRNERLFFKSPYQDEFKDVCIGMSFMGYIGYTKKEFDGYKAAQSDETGGDDNG